MTRDIQAEVQALIASIQRQDEPQTLKAIEGLVVGLLTDINRIANAIEITAQQL